MDIETQTELDKIRKLSMRVMYGLTIVIVVLLLIIFYGIVKYIIE